MTEYISIMKDNILDTSFKNSDIDLINSIPRITLKKPQQHRYIRIDEQIKFNELIENDKIVWLYSEWGLDDESFISSCYDSINLDKNKIFILKCEDIATVSEFIESFENQFQLTIQKFCKLISDLPSSTLYINQLNLSVYQIPNAFSRFQEILSSIIDYCNNIKIIITSNQMPNMQIVNDYVKLSPLDLPEIRTYTIKHPLAGIEYDKVTIINKLNSISSGLPKHLDNIFNKLKFASIEEIFEAEYFETQEINNDIQTIPKVIVQSILNLSNSQDIFQKRNYEMLKILTVLSNGETLKTLKQFNPIRPLNINNAYELEQLSLIEPVTIPTLIPKVSSTFTEYQEIKLLKVPRQVRDYINNTLTDYDKIDIVKKACDIYFGLKWRQGIIKNINRSVIKTVDKYLNYENYQIISVELLKHAILEKNKFEIERAANLCINLCEKLYESNDFKNSLSLSENIYYLMKNTDLIKQKAQITKEYGKSLRLVGNFDESDKMIKILKESLDLGKNDFSKNDIASIYVELAYVYVDKNDNEKIIEYSNKIKEITAKDSGKYLTAESLIIQYTFEGVILINKLKRLELKSRKLGHIYLSNNLAGKLSVFEEHTFDQKMKYLEKVLNSNDEYNKIIAFINKGELLIDNDLINDIDKELLLHLSFSYTYLYFQRLQSIFNKCHQVLWNYFNIKDSDTELLNLYRHSSFVWRIYGENELDEKYKIALYEKNIDFSIIVKSTENVININYYNKVMKQ